MTPHQWFMLAALTIGGIVALTPMIVLLVIVARDKPLV